MLMPLNDPKPAYQSATIVACFTVVVSGLFDLGMMAIDPTTISKAAFVTASTSVFGGLVGMYGRWRANRPIGRVIR